MVHTIYPKASSNIIYPLNAKDFCFNEILLHVFQELHMIVLILFLLVKQDLYYTSSIHLVQSKNSVAHLKMPLDLEAMCISFQNIIHFQPCIKL